MRWLRVAAPAASEADAERAAAALFAHGAVAVERDGAGPFGHFIDEKDAWCAASALSARAEEEPPPPWSGEWLAGQRSLLVTPRLFVTPTAAPQPAPAGAVRVLLDPSLAFGDGRHATTQLCLEALDEVLQTRPKALVLDVGCGNGVLAIAALLLGASRAVAVDVDPIAIGATQRNARRNGIADEPLEVLRELPREGAFDVVLANVPEEVHARLAGGIGGLLARGGALVLSGYAPERAERVEGFYARRRGWRRIVRAEWVVSRWA